MALGRKTIVIWRTWIGIVAVLAFVSGGIWIGLRWKGAIAPPATPRIACGIHCGTERWSVKTLTDQEANCINFIPKQTTVSWLTSQPIPERLSEEDRSGAIECQVWKVSSQLIGFKMEDDGDFHVVVADPQHPGLTMIVEIPDPACSGACSSAKETEIALARAHFEQVFGTPRKKFQRPNGTVFVTLTGVGFFDFKHRQTGLAPNGIELHPVLTFEVINEVPN